MSYLLFLADSRPPAFPDPHALQSSPRIGFRTETEAVDHACELLKAGKFVAAIQRPDGSLIGPSQISERCNPLAKFNAPT